MNTLILVTIVGLPFLLAAAAGLMLALFRRAGRRRRESRLAQRDPLPDGESGSTVMDNAGDDA